jgi:hypothetical protein
MAGLATSSHQEPREGPAGCGVRGTKEAVEGLELGESEEG